MSKPWLLALCMLFMVVQIAKADLIIDLPVNQTITVEFNYPTDAPSNGGHLAISYSLISNVNFLDPPVPPVAEYVLGSVIVGNSDQINIGISTDPEDVCRSFCFPNGSLSIYDPAHTIFPVTISTNIYALGSGGAPQTFPYSVTLSLDMQDLTIASVPEPPTWIMLLVGFAAIGFARKCLERTIITALR